MQGDTSSQHTAQAHPTASLSLCFAVILKGQVGMGWISQHHTISSLGRDPPWQIIESSSSVNGPHRDQSLWLYQPLIKALVLSAPALTKGSPGSHSFSPTAL